MRRLSRRNRQGGQAMIEFVLVSAFFWVPIIYFMMTLGFRLTRSVELIELVNDVSQMTARGVDFSVAGNQTMLTGTLAADFAMQGNGANTVTGGSTGPMAIVLSQYAYINSNDPACNSCANGGQIVLERRIIVGNKNLIGTQGSPASVGTIPGSDLNTTTGTCEQGDNNLPPPSQGTPSTCQYTDTHVQIGTGSFNTIMTNLPTDIGGSVGGTVFLVETYFTDISGRMAYQRSID
jgi:hypothetical protein